jgi:hypothetical protein
LVNWELPDKEVVKADIVKGIFIMPANVTITPSGTFVYGSTSVTIGSTSYVLQDFTVNKPSNVSELQGSQGETIAVVSVEGLREISGTFVKEQSKPDPELGDQFTVDGVTYFVSSTSESRSNGEFATLSFEGKEVLS